MIKHNLWKHQDLMILFQYLATSSLELIRLRARWEFTSFRWFTTKATKVFGPILWSAPMAVASTVAAASSLMEARVCAVEGAWYTFSDVSEFSLHFTCFTSCHFQKSNNWETDMFNTRFCFIIHSYLWFRTWVDEIVSIATGQHWRLVSSLFLSAGAVQLVPGDDTSTPHNQLVKFLGDLFSGWIIEFTIYGIRIFIYMIIYI